VSSIHVNGWFGAYDKLAMAQRLFAEVFACDTAALRSQFAFCGDSPNDAPMFGFFDASVGVQNVARFADGLEAPPKYITRAAAGAGFAELVDRLLA
jgi:hydroxymethylpyrimidine pyrophosphatase-like HAD family hydrolase